MKRAFSAPAGERRIPTIRPRRVVGVLERALLGAAMSFVLYVAERRLRGSRGAGRPPGNEERGNA